MYTFIVLHTYKIHTEVKHTTEQIKHIHAISQFVVRYEIIKLISVRPNLQLGGCLIIISEARYLMTHYTS